MRKTLILLVLLPAACVLEVAQTGKGTPGPEGAAGKDGARALVKVDPEAAGAHCADGGFKVRGGLDTDADGVLDDGEVQSTSYVCHGAQGEDGASGAPGGDGASGEKGETGAAGQTALVRVDPEPPGANCARGGVVVRAGLDADDSGTLSNAEATSTRYVCNGVILDRPIPKVWSVNGTTTVCSTAGTSYALIPEMTLTLDLEHDSVVLTEFDMNVDPQSGGVTATWTGVRLVTDTATDLNWTRVKPSEAGEDDHLHLFRVDSMPAGRHTVQAQWGGGAGSQCNHAANPANFWMRRLTAVAVPVEMGAKGAMKFGSTSVCQGAVGSAYQDIPDLDQTITLTEPSVVLAQFDLNWVGGASGHWKAARMVVDGMTDPHWTHSHPQGSIGDEDDHVHLFRLETLGAGDHLVKAQWGDGAGTMCNNAGAGLPVGRRIGWLAVPVSSGASAWYRSGATDVSKAAGAGFVTVPDMTLDAWLVNPGWHVALSHMDLTVGGAAASYMALRMGTDLVSDRWATHCQPLGGGGDAEDDHLHTHRADYVGPGPHAFRAEWGDGGGTGMYNNASTTFMTRRIGTMVIPTEW